MNLILSILPIALLVFLMTKKNSIPSHVALPLAALVLYLVKLFHFQSDPTLMNATVISGLLYAWTPILIIWGAILLFKTMEHSGSMDVIRNWLNGISKNKVAQLMIIGWAFAFLIEGASGFGTPAALAAPILIGLGFNPIKTAILCLVMNSVPVSFGAVGTPTWFGLGELGLPDELIREIGFKAAIIHFIAALVIPVFALRFVVSWDKIRKNLLFIYLSILSCTIPYLILARFDFEFPAILGGMMGLLVSVFLAKKQVGLEKTTVSDAPLVQKTHLMKAMFPLWGSILVLLITRIQQLGIKGLLTSAEHSIDIPLGPIGTFSINPSLVVQLQGIFGTDAGWKHQLLYIPSIVPFFLVSALAFYFFKMSRKDIKEVWSETYNRVFQPIIALLGAMVFVKLLMVDGDNACTMIIGNAFAQAAGENWTYFASYLGAIGSFFSGSNTVSNMTFGGIQDSIAGNLGLNRTTILALQNVGGAMGNMVCINNIVAVCCILGITNKEGYILKRTIVPLLIYGAIAGVVACFF
jgi:lactate permease